MKVLLADRLPSTAALQLKSAGLEVISAPDLQGDALRDAMVQHQPDALIVRSTRVQAPHLEASGRLGLIVRAGAGVNSIDVSGAAARGIYVANCPGRNAIAVAELAWGLIIAADRQIPNATRDLRAGLWRKKHYSAARGLYGRTLALVGLGNIGQAMIPRARAFGMPVIAWSRSLTAQRARDLGVEAVDSLHELASRADVVSVHVALTNETRGLIGEAFIEAMQPGSIFINTSRGEVVDEPSLLEGVRSKALRCGLDVWSQEPSGGAHSSDELAAQELVFGTCHIAASTDQAQEAVAAQAISIVLAWQQTGTVPCCVNMARRSAATHLLVVRHLDRVGVLASVLEVLRGAQINVQEMENIIFEGGQAAVARIRLGSAPCSQTLTGIEGAEHVLALDLVSLEAS